MRCDSCEMLSINGLPCHEMGCPNRTAKWRDGEWIKQRTCFTCGYEVDANDPCCDADNADEQ